MTDAAIPPVSRHPDIQGGNLCVAGTRIPVCGLLGFRAAGYTPDAIAREYPSLTADRIRDVLAYVDAHPDVLAEPPAAIPPGKVEVVMRAMCCPKGSCESDDDVLNPPPCASCGASMYREEALAAIRAAAAWDAAERKRQREARTSDPTPCWGDG